MPDKLEALGVLLVLLPGFCSAYVIQQLCVRRKQTELDKVVEALLFSFFLFLVTLPFFGYVLPVSWHPVPAKDGTAYTIAFNARYLWTLFLLAIAAGAAYAVNINHDLALQIFRRIGFTERTARYSIWNDVFQDIPGVTCRRNYPTAVLLWVISGTIRTILKRLPSFWRMLPG
jgi:di/tricarboxylate transporter